MPVDRATACRVMRARRNSCPRRVGRCGIRKRRHDRQRAAVKWRATRRRATVVPFLAGADDYRILRANDKMCADVGAFGTDRFAGPASSIKSKDQLLQFMGHAGDTTEVPSRRSKKGQVASVVDRAEAWPPQSK